MANRPEDQPTTSAAGSTPDAKAETEGRQTDPQQTQDSGAKTPPATSTTSTQSNMGSGDGIRGEYGNASQTNGLEGGPDSGADGSPAEED